MARGGFFYTSRGVIRRVFSKRVNIEAERALEQEVNNIISKVRSHPVGVELSLHSSPSNLFSKPKGSLFGFMGFKEGRDPIGELIQYLREPGKFKLDRIKPGNIDIGLKIKLIGPSSDDMVANGIVTDEWGDGRSWPEMIETGIPHLNRFLSREGTGRSSEGFLTSHKPNEDLNFKPVKFLSKIFKDSRRRFYLNLTRRLL